jgi:hypothetical protein
MTPQVTLCERKMKTWAVPTNPYDIWKGWDAVVLNNFFADKTACEGYVTSHAFTSTEGDRTWQR